LFFAAIWALLAGIVIFFTLGGTSVTETALGADPSEMIVTQISYFEMQGWWGVWMLITFAALFYGPLHFYRRGSRPLAALFAVVAITLSILAGFSIGAFYFPAAFALLIGLVSLPFVRNS
jgi:hypothetical protein